MGDDIAVHARKALLTFHYICFIYISYRFVSFLLLFFLFFFFFFPVFNSVSRKEAFYFFLSLSRSFSLSVWLQKIRWLQIPFTVAAQAQTPATRARRSNVRVTGPVLVRDSVQSRSVVEGTVGRDETLFDASGPLEFLSSDALVSGVIGSRNGRSRGTGHVAAQPSIEFDGRWWWPPAILLLQRYGNRKGEHLGDAVLHVVSQPGGQTARVQLVEFDQLEQVIEPGYSLVEGVQPAVAPFVENLKSTWDVIIIKIQIIYIARETY